MAFEIPSGTSELGRIEEQDINLGGAATGATIELPDQPRLFDPENLDQTALDI